ncbi:hypothetical protein MIR68_004990 [Amoeboaphelidium protococcarum]|nr:hypothetical protein MIR68_004990 [Amoeboaphelidium protococcarum]
MNALNIFQQVRNAGSITFKGIENKKGARRRQWWNPKMLNSKMKKGYGAGSGMRFVAPPTSVTESGEVVIEKRPGTGYQFNPEALKLVVPPEAFSIQPLNAAAVKAPATLPWHQHSFAQLKFQPYVDNDLEIDFTSKPINYLDWFVKMEQKVHIDKEKLKARLLALRDKKLSEGVSSDQMLTDDQIEQEALQQVLPKKEFYLKIFKKMEQGSETPAKLTNRYPVHKFRFGKMAKNVIGEIERMKSNHLGKWGA